MAAVDVSFVLLFFFLPAGLSCPRLCSCSDKYGRHFAECSFKDLSAVPVGLPPNVTTVSLSANRIASVAAGSFDSTPQVTSLWMTRNMIVSIEHGAISVLIQLRNLDLSHNRLSDFPWKDLENLTSLQLLKLDHNKLEILPHDAFSNLKELNSLRLNDNRFKTINEGTFDNLIALSYLQIYNNPFSCTCSLNWLKDWILNAKINIADKNLTICATPEELQGELLLNLPDSECESPNVTIKIDNDSLNGSFFEGSLLILTCEFSGNPQPTVKWRINSKKELALMLTENDSAEMLDNSLKVYHNGTLVIFDLKREDSGRYSCSASNEFGRDEKSVLIEVLKSQKATDEEELTSASYAKATLPSQPKTTNSGLNLNSEEVVTLSENHLNETLKHISKCGLTSNTKYVSSHVFNASFDDVKQYTFDFGVIALGVSETAATVRINPLLKPREISENSEEDEESNGLYLCVTSDPKHNAVQWTRIKDGVNTYHFTGLRPGTNYSLCLTYRGEDCEVQVLFATRKRLPNLMIIISVSICLLTVSTVPLLGATCFHLIYIYRCKTYKLVLKAKNQCHVEKASYKVKTEKEMSECFAEEEETDSGDKEQDTEESIVADTTSQDKSTNDCEVESEYSDRLPLGAEAVNITDSKY